MIFGIGTDLVAIHRVEAARRRFGDRFAERILTPRELARYRRSTTPASFLAKCFAVKEATAKAMGVGFKRGLRPAHIGTDNKASGQPVLEFTGRAMALRAELGIGEGHVSISDEADYALAFVTLLVAREGSARDG